MKVRHLFERSGEVFKLVDFIDGKKSWLDADGNERRVEQLDDLYALMEHLGYKMQKVTDKGVFSTVVVNASGDPEYILKISKKGRYKSDPFFQYAEFAQKMGSNSIYPKIPWVGEISDGKEQRGLCFMEYLLIDPSRIASIDPRMSDPNVVRKFFREDIPKYFNQLASWELKILTEDIFDQLGIDPAEIKQFLSQIRKQKLGRLDIHQENFGWRDNGDFVIFDPVSAK
jgi:hypothetical protein